MKPGARCACLSFLLFGCGGKITAGADADAASDGAQVSVDAAGTGDTRALDGGGGADGAGDVAETGGAKDTGGVPETGGYGPQASITCPAGAVNISPGEDIVAIVEARAAGTTFCILAGTHHPTAPINPKSNDVLVGQYGAIIDGTNLLPMSFDVGSTSIIRGWNCGTTCGDVTVRNLVIRNLPKYHCIGMYSGGDRWTVDHNDVSGCLIGLNMMNGGRVTNNYFHHHSSFAIGGYRANNAVIDHNEIAHSGGTGDSGGSTGCTKWAGDESGVANLTITNNYVHDCNTTGLWLDGAGSGSVIAGNRIENNMRGGVEWEVSLGGTVHDNTFSGNGVAIFISNSQDVEVYNNTIRQQDGLALQLFVDANRLSTFNNHFHHNQVDLSGHPVSPVAGLSCTGTSTCTNYGTANNNRFDNNAYDTGGRAGSAFWMWGRAGLTWAEWKAIPEDVNGSVK